MNIKVVAAIDVGSFELALGIYEISLSHGIREIEYIRHTIALGSDTYTQGKITYEHIHEVCICLKDYKKIMENYQVEDYRAFATSALREAQNNQIVLDQIRVKTGIKVSILSNSEERFLSYKSIASKESDFNKIIQKGTAIVDVGFGSTQLSLFDKDVLVTTQNLRLGSLRIREMLIKLHSNRETIHNVIDEMVQSDIDIFDKMYLKDREIENLIGIGDGIKYFTMYLRRKLSYKTKIDRITSKQFMELFDQMLALSYDDMEEAFDIPSRFVPMVIPSAIIYKRVLDHTGAEMLWVPEGGLCDGIVAAFADDKKLLPLSHDFTEDILMAARNIAKRYRCNRHNYQTLEYNVLKIFDTMKYLHGLGKRERLLLQIAAYLHDCGKYISIKNYQECSYNIIMSTEIIGISHREREIVSNVVRHATGEVNYYERTEDQLDKDYYLTLAKLTAILSIGNALDKSHKQKLKRIKVTIQNNRLVILTNVLTDITLEQIALEEKSAFFEEIYGIKPVIRQKRSM